MNIYIENKNSDKTRTAYRKIYNSKTDEFDKETVRVHKLNIFFKKSKPGYAQKSWVQSYCYGIKDRDDEPKSFDWGNVTCKRCLLFKESFIEINNSEGA